MSNKEYRFEKDLHFTFLVRCSVPDILHSFRLRRDSSAARGGAADFDYRDDGLLRLREMLRVETKPASAVPSGLFLWLLEGNAKGGRRDGFGNSC